MAQWTEGGRQRGPSHTGPEAGSLVRLRGDCLDACPTGRLCGGPLGPRGRVPGLLPRAGSVEDSGPPSSWACPVQTQAWVVCAVCMLLVGGAHGCATEPGVPHGAQGMEGSSWGVAEREAKSTVQTQP